jgi:hypothetical protein
MVEKVEHPLNSRAHGGSPLGSRDSPIEPHEFTVERQQVPPRRFLVVDDVAVARTRCHQRVAREG